jgi:excisionase family DNA binding protein
MQMINIYSFKDQLDRIEKKLDRKRFNRYLNINQVAEFTSLSISTLRRAIRKGELKCSKRVGKLLFQESDVRRWIDG